MKFIPYVYEIRDTIRGVSYIGSEYGTKTKLANPDNLWNTYFTSSKLVRQHIKQYGKDSFDERTILFADTSEDDVTDKIANVIVKESEFLSSIDAKNSEIYLNQHNGDGKFLLTQHTQETKNKIRTTRLEHNYLVSDETRRKMSEKAQGRVSPNKGIKFNDEWRANLRANSVGMKGQFHSPETKEKMSVAAKGRITPDDVKKKQSEIKTSEEWKASNYKTCCHCNKHVSSAMFTRWHGPKCKSLTSIP